MKEKGVWWFGGLLLSGLEFGGLAFGGGEDRGPSNQITKHQATSPADWPQFRGPEGKAVSEEKNLPVRWSAKENIRWQVDLPGRGLSSPVIAKGKVYLTACTGFQESRLHVLCFELKNGNKLWERKFSATGVTLCHPKTCMAAPTPATDGESVCALFATGDLVCLDSAGNLVWYRSLVGDYPTIGNNVGMAASPVLWKDVLLLPMENAGESFVAGIDKRTGKNIWRNERGRDISWVTPLVIHHRGRDEAIFQSHNEITSLDPATGNKLWSYKDSFSTIATPVFGKGLLLAATAGMTGLRFEENQSVPKPAWSSSKLQTYMASPLYYQDRVYAVNNTGILNCADAETGKNIRQERVKGQYSSSPIAADGKIYLVNEDGMTTVVQTGPQPKILATNVLDDKFLATPAIADGAIFLRSDKHLYCMGEKKAQ